MLGYIKQFSNKSKKMNYKHKLTGKIIDSKEWMLLTPSQKLDYSLTNQALEIEKKKK